MAKVDMTSTTCRGCGNRIFESIKSIELRNGKFEYDILDIRTGLCFDCRDDEYDRNRNPSARRDVRLDNQSSLLEFSSSVVDWGNIV